LNIGEYYGLEIDADGNIHADQIRNILKRNAAAAHAGEQRRYMLIAIAPSISKANELRSTWRKQEREKKSAEKKAAEDSTDRG